MDAHQHIAENIGTSFACPLVATVAANVHQQLNVDPSAVSPSLIKALLVHSAFLKEVPGDTDDLNYFGVGRPLEAANVVSCRQSSATVIFQIPLFERFEFGKRPFPIPSCLIDNTGLKAEIFMTLAYEPPVDRAYGIEYCRCNVTASLGTMAVDDENAATYNREVKPVPKSISKGYEQDLVKHGYKWCPLKLYYRKFKNGPKDKDWRLTLDLLTRSEFHINDSQMVTLIVTIRDPEMKAQVYDELVRDMNRLNWQVQNLEVQARSRLQS